MLLLIDIDGTLLFGRPGAHADALARATRHVLGVPARAADVDAIDPAGRTDLDIGRRLAAAHGVPTARFHAVRARWIRAAEELFPGLPDPEPQRPAPDAAEALGSMAAMGARLALVTGNLREIARIKLQRAGLDGFFAGMAGAFGADGEERADLVRAGCRRAGRQARDAVVIGDTPRDIVAAHAAGTRCIAVATGHFGAGRLRAADAVAESLSEAARTIAGWSVSGDPLGAGARPRGQG